MTGHFARRITSLPSNLSSPQVDHGDGSPDPFLDNRHPTSIPTSDLPLPTSHLFPLPTSRFPHLILTNH
jgi:hypothetical protein